MANYKFDWLNGSHAIINPTWVKNGFTGGNFVDNVSQGTFIAHIKLENSGGIWGVALEGTTLPVDFTTEQIDIWIENELLKYVV